MFSFIQQPFKENYYNNIMSIGYDEDNSIIEPDESFVERDMQFSHQSLVMIAMKKCLELGSKELREGWVDEKIDKNGNVTKQYHEDTRKAFIEAVKSLLMMTEFDYDEEALKNIPQLLKQIEERKKFWMNEEWKWWSSLSNAQKQNQSNFGKAVIQNCFNKKLDFDNYFAQEELDLYRRICTEINNVVGRKDWYYSEGYEN
jgi:hypothetical protein